MWTTNVHKPQSSKRSWDQPRPRRSFGSGQSLTQEAQPRLQPVPLGVHREQFLLHARPPEPFVDLRGAAQLGGVHVLDCGTTTTGGVSHEARRQEHSKIFKEFRGAGMPFVENWRAAALPSCLRHRVDNVDNRNDTSKHVSQSVTFEPIVQSDRWTKMHAIHGICRAFGALRHRLEDFRTAACGPMHLRGTNSSQG